MTTIRPATVEDAAALAEVHVASWRETYGRMLPGPVLNRMSPAIHAERWRRMLSDASRPRVYIAEQNGWTVGFVHGGRCRDAVLAKHMPVLEAPDPQVSGSAAGPEAPGHATPGDNTDGHAANPMEIYEIYLLDAVKRQGIGGRLLATIAGDFVAHGATAAGVWVLGDNQPARAFYERFGGEAVAEKVERFAGFDVHEVGYVWRDLRRALVE